MNPSTQALASGFSVLLAMSGEPLKLLRVAGDVPEIPSLVDRTPETRHEKGLSFEAERGSIIELFHTAVTPAPAPGETFVDGNDINHRISTVHVIDGFKLRCKCVTSE